MDRPWVHIKNTQDTYRTLYRLLYLGFDVVVEYTMKHNSKGHLFNFYCNYHCISGRVRMVANVKVYSEDFDSFNEDVYSSFIRKESDRLHPEGAIVC
jgi:hypothetical protein